jgi:hypothetical protein
LHTLPALAAYAVTAVLNKYAMGLGSLAGAVYGYMYVQSVTAVLLMGGYSFYREHRAPSPFWRKRQIIYAAAVLSFGWVCHMIAKNYAMAFVPNPSYQGAIALTAPLFIAFFYKWKKHKEEADVTSGMGIVFCVIALVLLTV